MSVMTIIGLSILLADAFVAGLIAGWWLAMRRIELQLTELSDQKR